MKAENCPIITKKGIHKKIFDAHIETAVHYAIYEMFQKGSVLIKYIRWQLNISCFLMRLLSIVTQIQPTEIPL